MTNVDRWKVVDQFTIYQIALLIEDHDPADFERQEVFDWPSDVRSQVSPMLTALRHAVQDESLSLHRRVDEDYDGTISFQSSLIHVDQLRPWLAAKGIRRSFFAPPVLHSEVFDSPIGEFYAPKLAAANAAWKAVTSDRKRLRGKSPKQALTDWLTEHAAEYDLINKDGTPNVSGIEEAAKVANWKPGGGAPATPETEGPSTPAPSGEPQRGKPAASSARNDHGGRFNPTPGRVRVDPRAGSTDPGSDDEIPF